MDNNDITYLLVRYITHAVNAAEITQIKEWINAHPENEQYFAQLYETWHDMLYRQPADVTFKKAPVKHLSISRQPQPPYSKRFQLSDLLVYCSTVILFTGFIYIVLNIYNLGVF